MDDHPSLAEKAALQKDQQLFQWQNRLLPWMIFIPTVLIGSFILLATMQLNKFEKYVYEGSKNKIVNHTPSAATVSADTDMKQNADYLRWFSLVEMEEHSINRRYNQGGVLLMSRIYIKYLGFFTGMILAIVGSVFIISKLKEDVSELEGTIQEKSKFRLASSSPGIIFGVLGTALMMTTILTHSEINVKDMPLYLNAHNISQTQKTPEVKKQPAGKIDPKAVEEFDMQSDTSLK